MNVLLILAFLFFIGSVGGWCLELFYRRFFSKNNPEKKWINPGFCTGPYLPLYGSGLCILYLLCSLEPALGINNAIISKTAVLLMIGAAMTAIEYISGSLALKFTKVMLWDYSKERGNIRGLICPKFSFFWTLLGALYCFAVHPYILGALRWLSENLAFSFFIGLFFGVFITDASHSVSLVAKLKKFAEENDVIVRYEELKNSFRRIREEAKQKYRFFSPFKTDKPISEQLRELKDSFEKKLPKVRK